MANKHHFQCPYCGVQRVCTDDEQIWHDIQRHDGLNRMRSTHRLVCQNVVVGDCFCNLRQYERVSKERSRSG